MWLYGHMSVWVYRCVVYGYVGVGMYEFVVLQVCGYMDMWVLGLCKCLDVCVYGCVCVCEYVGVQGI